MPAASIEEFMAALPDDQRRALEALHDVIKAAVPDAAEVMSYGVPGFKYDGRPLVGYGAAKAHCALYVMSPAALEAHSAEIEALDTSKGTIRFTPDKPLPSSLVVGLVKTRIAEIEAAKKPKKKSG